LNKNKYVLDSWALIAWLENQDGADKVADLISKAKNNDIELCDNVLNLGEVYYISMRKKGEQVADTIIENIEKLPLEIIEPLDRAMIMLASKIKANHTIALADVFCAATASIKEAIIATGDSEFKQLESEYNIYWLRDV